MSVIYVKTHKHGNFCLERMSEIKPKLVDRYEMWHQHNPHVKAELDMPRMLSAMAVRDNEELALRAQASRMKRAASKDQSARRSALAEDAKRKPDEPVRRDSYPFSRPEDIRNASRQPQVYDTAARQTYEDARRRQEETRRAQEDTRRREAEAEQERRRREAEEEGRRREAEIARRKYEEAQRQDHAARQGGQQEPASRRQTEENEYRRQRDDARRREVEETSRREQEGIAARQREADQAKAQANRVTIQIPIPVPIPIPIPDPPLSSSSSSGSSNTALNLTPRQLEGLPVLPLESPTREDSADPRNGRHHPQPQYAMPDRASGRTCVSHVLSTLTSVLTLSS